MGLWNIFRREKTTSELSPSELSNNQWFNLICSSLEKQNLVIRGNPLPSFPSSDYQERTTGISGKATLEEAFKFYCDCAQNFNGMNNALSEQSVVLDFGVGWGRIARFFLKETPLNNIYGLDVEAESIQICKECFGTNNFFVCSAYPPTQLAESTFTHIVGYSVFSHLSEEACRLWMEEFHRLLKPNGSLALTTRGNPFFRYCESLKGRTDLDSYSSGLSTLFEDFEAAKSAYNRGEFVHSNKKEVSGGGAMTSEFYGETFIPEAYARDAYKQLFELHNFDTTKFHPTMFFKKK
ncbi:class I SAM-dependent methyltransferase [Leptolyngbyaceae cyanobacterium CCMR0082]|uniref:Class I SAM-dependent methyltransferase n=2 Tax=Adonisia turfae TaxID=2950184 RepID=A0A6M0S470_9CYAN|nr:class I SAM-dependent methyltransferase [Adonisia turfae]MDV3351553.1 class I SAM-dependent methyltransferase [Leptothoe sp. LEGE 181152]NEZ54628.1 class I SAM-dependent methyltransferase [Adonisia turfae CCMR0081]NEZ63175.1 class I SAM-dependent methyltransferase [Adonisia turfae CCMR0082]